MPTSYKQTPLAPTRIPFRRQNRVWKDVRAIQARNRPATGQLWPRRVS